MAQLYGASRYPRRIRSGYSGYSGYRRRRYPTTRYRKSRYPARASSARSVKSSFSRKKRSAGGMSLSELTRNMRKLELLGLYGHTRQLVFEHSLPLKVYWRGPLADHNYFVVPVSAMISAVLAQVPKEKAWLSSVTLEMQVMYSRRMRMQLSAFSTPVRDMYGGLQLGEQFQFTVGAPASAGDQKASFMSMADPGVRTLISGVFASPGVDGTLFDAALEKEPDASVRLVDSWMVRRGGEEDAATKRKKLLQLSFKPGADMQPMEIVSETIRVHCYVGKEMALKSKTGFVLFGGLRADCSLPAVPSSQMTPDKADGYCAGSISKLRVTFHVRC